MLTAFFMHTTHAIHLALGLTLYARLVFFHIRWFAVEKTRWTNTPSGKGSRMKEWEEGFNMKPKQMAICFALIGEEKTHS